MGLRTALGLKKVYEAVPQGLDLSKFDVFNPDDPYLSAYGEAIAAAQSGKHDSLQKQFRYFILYQAALRACREHPDLDMVECGCFLGHSTFMLARVLEQNGFRGQLHVFDSFEGLSEFSDKDAGSFHATAEQQAKVRAHFKSDFDRVSALLSRFPFVTIYKGWIPERFNDAPDRPIGLLSIDVDMYEPTRDSILKFFPRLVEGGSVFLDDYGSNNFPGARKAIDEFLSEAPHQMLLRMPFASALVVK